MAQENDKLVFRPAQRTRENGMDTDITLTMGHEGNIEVEVGNLYESHGYAMTADEVRAMCDWLGYAPKWGQK